MARGKARKTGGNTNGGSSGITLNIPGEPPLMLPPFFLAELGRNNMWKPES